MTARPAENHEALNAARIAQLLDPVKRNAPTIAEGRRLASSRLAVAGTPCLPPDPYDRGFQGHDGMAIASSESSVPTDSPQATGSQQV